MCDSRLQTDDGRNTTKINQLQPHGPSPISAQPASFKRHGVGGGGEEGLTTLSLGLGSGAAAFTGRSAQRLPAILSPPSRGRWVLLAASSPPPESVPPAQKSITLAAQVYTGMP